MDDFAVVPDELDIDNGGIARGEGSNRGNEGSWDDGLDNGRGVRGDIGVATIDDGLVILPLKTARPWVVKQASVNFREKS